MLQHLFQKEADVSHSQEPRSAYRQSLIRTSPSQRRQPSRDRDGHEHRFSERLALLLLLQRIESIQATHCGRRDGRTYYSIAIYLRQFQSRIPTSSRKHSDPSFVTSGEPHFQIERRFSEFRKLRDCIHKHAFDCGFCSFCGDVLQYVYCSESQPRLLTPVFKGPDQVLSMLTTFLNDLLELSVGSKSSNSRVCEGRERIPSRLAAFLRIRTDNTGEPSM